MSRNLLLISTSTTHGTAYLEHAEAEVKSLLQGKSSLLFIPYARPGGISHKSYTAKVQEAFAKWNIAVTGVHEYDDALKAVNEAEAVFIGGGNTFLLLRNLYANHLVKPLQERAAKGMPYMGTSAGSNVAGKSIGTTNDMPIVHVKTLDALQLVPFNLNPHYQDPAPGDTHMGETRETRINEFHNHHSQPVVGLREGSMLRITDDRIELKGELPARIFLQGQPPMEFKPGDDIDFLMDAV